MKNFILSLFCIAGTSAMTAQSIVVNDPADPQTNLDAEELIREVLISGSSCVEIELTDLQENPDGVADLNQRSWGYFKKGASDFPFEEGIVLSSGFAVSAEGPNNSTATSDGTFIWPGDNDLKTILDNLYGIPQETNNATVFEFTFTSSLTEIDFEFIFASEEYENQFECSDSWRDGFAFLVKGPGIPDDSGAPFGGTNIGSVPGSNDVIVNTASIHLGSGPILPCPGQVLGVDYFPDLYVSNSGASNTNEVQFDGLTTILTTATLTIVPNELYTIKMVIADRGDASYDSAVFLNAGSFNLGTDLGIDITIASGNAECEGTIITLDTAVTNPDVTFEWFKDGILIPGENSSTLDVISTGLYRVEIMDTVSGCLVFDEILVEFYPNPDVQLGADQLICDGGGSVELDATPVNIADLQDVSYKWFLNGTEIVGETSSTLTATEAGVYTAEVTATDCVGTDDVTVGFEIAPEFDLGDERLLCDEQNIVLDATPTNLNELDDVSYQWFKDGAALAGETNSTLTVSETGLYAAEVTGNGCVQMDEVNVIAFFFTVDLGEDRLFCDGDSFEIVPVITGGDPNDATYLWSTGETTPTITVSESNTYSVDVSIADCTKSDSIVVTFLQNPEVELGADFQKCKTDISILNAAPSNYDEGEATYVWTLDGGTIAGATDSTLEITEPGIYGVTVTAGDCSGSDSIVVEFYDNENCVITQGISPNGDNQNDFFDLSFLNDEKGIVSISIFNRDGLLIYEKEKYVNEWYGQTNDGDELPVGTYYYVIKLENNDPVTGWVYINK